MRLCIVAALNANIDSYPRRAPPCGSDASFFITIQFEIELQFLRTRWLLLIIRLLAVRAKNNPEYLRIHLE